MDRVVFEATEPTDRLEADSFSELLDVYLEPIRTCRLELQSSIRDVAEQVIREEVLIGQLPALKKEESGLGEQISAWRKELGSLLPQGKEERARRLASLEKACGEAEAKVQALQRRRKLLEELGVEVEQTRTTREPDRHTKMMRRFEASGVSPEDWHAFRMIFEGDVDGTLERQKLAVDQSISFTKEGDPSTSIDWSTVPTEGWPLKTLREARDKTKGEVGIDKQKRRNYERLQTQIEHASGAKKRWEDLISKRRSRYADVFGTYVQEEEVLKQLYLPLANSLRDSKGAMAKLSFVVKRRVDLDGWVQKGEALLDLRRESDFRGHGTLRQKAMRYLLEAWTKGTAQDVANAMDNFRKEFHAEFRKAKPAFEIEAEERVWTQQVADWLYDTNHVQVLYSIEYDGVAIEQLSPGTRGIVLLLLYLAVDQHDRRPLIVDQPEENLDPESVFTELVPHFRAARRRRQIIVVTHNANLVVNTDADQVIVAESTQTEAGGLPTISYRSGSIENLDIRNSICQILEGGERAFLERARRYRLRGGESWRVEGG